MMADIIKMGFSGKFNMFSKFSLSFLDSLYSQSGSQRLYLPDIFAKFLDVPAFFFFHAFISAFFGSLTAYGISRIDFRTKNLYLLVCMSTLAFPIPLMMITMYIIFNQLNMLNTFFPIIIGHIVITLPVVIWIMKDFFDTLPLEVEEAAIIDGSNIFELLFYVVFPMSKPGLTASAIFVFVTSWNEFIFGLTFTNSNDMRPLPAGISLLFLQEYQYKWPEMMAVAVFATLPVLILFYLLIK